ncbi:MAG TPA: nuclear transport factor 2 family protein, partial [Puia sp.]
MLLSTLLFSVIAAPVFAQSKDESKDERAVSTAVEALRKALVDPDKTTLDALVLDELTYGHSNGNLQDKAAFEEALLNKSSD